ncbi:MAG: putative selenium-dependent hydroxylase accessory protein YqeC [Oscillospiraceae bacterium]|nr:putative selenium-dependent hydroxylase accessory protein YqeC [Oscillospiraceae bacterium]
MQISDLLQIGRGVTALIGGGGKTTLLYRLAEELRKKGTVILATSTRIYPPQQYALVMDGEAAVLRRALKEYGVVAVGTINEEGKLRAPVFSFEELATFADYVLVEADGAKCRPLKAHASHEPVIPDNAQRVVLVVGADGFGKPIEEVCHRPELYAPRCGAAAEDAVTAELAAKVILAEGYGDRVYINKVETAQDYDRAVHLAQLLRCPVVAGSLHQGVFACLR